MSTKAPGGERGATERRGAEGRGDAAPGPPDESRLADSRRRGALLRLWWVDLHPHQMPALLLALTDAILDLHNGELSLSPGGLLLYWPARRMVCPEVPVGDGVEVRESR